MLFVYFFVGPTDCLHKLIMRKIQCQLNWKKKGKTVELPGKVFRLRGPFLVRESYLSRGLAEIKPSIGYSIPMLEKGQGLGSTMYDRQSPEP
jgi:hypothetical protein